MKFKLVTGFAVLSLTLGFTASARNNSLDSSLFTNCDEVALPFAVYVVQAEMAPSLMEKIIAADDTSVATTNLTFPKSQTIAVVVDGYTKGQLVTLPVVIRAPSGEEVWRADLKLRQTSGGGDALRITRAAEIKPDDWKVLKNEGVYTVETLKPEGVDCSTTVSSWFLVY